MINLKLDRKEFFAVIEGLVRSLLLHHPLVHLDEAFLLRKQSFERLDALSQHSIRLHGNVSMHGCRAEVAVRLNLSVSG